MSIATTAKVHEKANVHPRAVVGEGAVARTDRTDASTDRMLCSVLEAAKAEASKAHILRAQAA